jgi:GAF domain-containing protein
MLPGARFFAETVRTAIARQSPQESLQAAIAMAVESGPCDAASITALGPRRSVSTIAHSDDRVLRADELQYELSEGPCLDAVWADGIYVIPDLLADGRWPRWAPQASEMGVGATISVHLFTDTRLGSLNLYSVNPRTFDENDVENARVVAAHASVVLAYARNTDNLSRAADSRNLIGQAQGILMGRYRVSAPTAFAALRRYSQDRNIKLHVLCEELTTTGELPDLDRYLPAN